MCKSLAEGGMRCASHTGGPYRKSLQIFKENESVETISSLTETATKYASTPSGAAVMHKQLSALTPNSNLHAILSDALDAGLAEYREHKERSAEIKEQERRVTSIEWAHSLPESEEADAAYRNQIATELNLDEETFALAWQVSLSDDTPEMAHELPAARFIIRDSSGRVSATSLSPEYLNTLNNFEGLASYARLKQRERADRIDDHGGLWIRYENDTVSEILRCVDYKPETGELNVALNDSNGADHHWYKYTDVPQDIVDHMCSARSMGRFYAHVFSGLADGSKLPYKSVNDVSFVARLSNNLHPVEPATGPVPQNTQKVISTYIRR